MEGAVTVKRLIELSEELVRSRVPFWVAADTLVWTMSCRRD